MLARINPITRKTGFMVSKVLVNELKVRKLRKEFKIKNKKALNIQGFVDRLGLEPRLTEPKSVVLPLHHRSIPVIFECAKLIKNI